MLGLGSETPRRVAVDEQGRMRASELARELADVDGPTIVCAQAGNVNTGASDPLAEVAEACRAGAPGCTSTARSDCGPR